MGGDFAVLNVIIAGVAFALGLFLLLGRENDNQRLYFSLLTIAFSAWILCNYFGNAQAYVLVIGDYVIGTFLGLLFWLFSRESKWRSVEYRGGHQQSSIIGTALVLIVVTAIVALILGGFIVTLTTASGTNSPSLGDGSLYIVYPSAIFILGALSIYNLVTAQMRSTDVIQKRRIQLVLIGLFIAFVSIVIPNLVLENLLPKGNEVLVASYNSAYVGILVFLAISTYAIVRHGLFDIKLAAVRSAAYISSLLTMAAVYYALAYGLSVFVLGGQSNNIVSASPVNILLALFLTLIFQPIKQFFDRITNRYFYKETYNSDDFFSRLSHLLTSTTDLRGLLERLSTEMAQTLKSEQVFFYLYQTGSSEHHMSSGTSHHSRLPQYDARSLDEYAAKIAKPVLLTGAVTDTLIRRMLISHKIAVVVPLKTGNGIVGYVMLGEHQSGSYTKRDLSVLATVSNELVVAIQNALSLHEVKELNATLQQRIDVATKELRSSNAQLKHLDEVKDEFMSMASHQLRTPLTSVKGYISMVLEGDAGKVSPQQEKLLKEAFSSSERMVGLIADFLNISRLQTGKFIIEKAPTDIKQLIKQEINDLKLIADSHDMKLRLTMTDKPLPVIADRAKLQQVVMNFVDNAIYYSPSGGMITINLDRVKDDVAFTVADTGIGVPEAEQAKLFTKFFRAKNARKQRPDGTGVGLYLARRVITAHNGSLIFSSVEGKGSTFGFRIPLDQSVDAKK